MLAHIDFYSKCLQMKTGINVLLPDEPKEPMAVLVLLHGLGDDENSWFTQTALERYASQQSLVIITPRAERSYYQNNLAGQRYFDYLCTELLVKCRTWFNLNANVQQTFIGGLSMGGFGAAQAALLHPEIYNSAFLLSAALDMPRSWRKNKERELWYQTLFGSLQKLENSESDLFNLVRAGNRESEKPYIWQLCGREDQFYQENCDFSRLLKQNGYQNLLIEVEGSHTWDVWDRAIVKVIAEIKRLVSDSEQLR
ncbi:alpha/beta hydrolase [Liquorilactobacillus satsumensis]|uniref:Esterase n=1 Tax=Liquorilactobacillus satsumensis DSM 16230 = JCM 12392 TaxID=1423801 RepID=A0A0R1UUX9_9LACO|nr:alpha/beta hydrolase-fold protein [Liquorilactobacillus satsumensis]KRL96988.1 esterase [Liquorilactobacillus satsumensis DSM 16230 = JCM 12392]MCC7667159.1 tributyrin esterase [Liquorilactobacillus satsumensis]MCP9312495.1 tributyrin esterase [Liquorilactobacillus satsumensis]MCP9329082.1 tributyrin esterase [Liquorilactobacillus satsumensis]MCP9357752.1 tributyrin esterase [Liquorilactobacillus satsumensis]